MDVLGRDAEELRGILKASGMFDPGSRAFLLVNALESSGRSFEVQATTNRGAVSEAERLRGWLYYIAQTTSDDNVLAACELAEKGEAAEFDTTGGQ
jgi:hypothetical protein